MEPIQSHGAPKVSVLMVTYNHERYIAEAVGSALSQKTTFPVEIVIGEDCSTDNTRNILRELKRVNDHRIRLILREQNIGGPANVAATFAECRGDYVAMLEGDDYWTDPCKLQKQVDSLDAHPHWSACFHTTRRVYVDGSREPEVNLLWTQDEATIEDLFKTMMVSTCSLVFRNRLFGPLPAWHQQITSGDWAICLLNAAQGPLGCLHEVMADYRIHSQGAWTQKSEVLRLRETLRLLSFVDHHFQGKYRELIDEFRLNSMAAMLGQIERYRQVLPYGFDSLPAIVVAPPQRRRSAAAKLIRQVLRPVEQAVRKWRAA